MHCSWEGVPGPRAESPDCVIYAMAIRNLVTANLDRREKEVLSITMPEARPTVVRSAWLGR